MRAVFGILSLVVALAIVGVVAKKQMQSSPAGIAARGDGAASEAASLSDHRGAAVADPSGLSAAKQARDIEERARTETTRALQQGADRNAQADP